MAVEENPDLFDAGLLRTAKRTMFYQRDIIALSKILPESDGELVALLEMQSNLLEAEIFSNLWVAALWAGRKIPGRLLKTGAQFFPDVGHLLATAHLCEGTEETCEALLDAIESGHLGSHRELISLICAARRWEQDHEGPSETLEFPERLLFLARRQARKHERLFSNDFEILQEMLLSILARILKDEGLLRLLEDSHIDLSKVNASFEKRFFKESQSLKDFVPNERPERVISGYQVRRSVPKLSRNASCPCGSGKKYKKCCFANDQKKLSQSSEVEGVTLDELEKDREAHLTPDGVRELRFYELKRLKPEKLSEEVIIPVVSRLMLFEELDHVFTMYEKTSFKDLLIWEGFFEDLLHYAIKKKRGDLVDRALELFPVLEEKAKNELAFMRGREQPEEFLEVLEARCRELLIAEDEERDELEIDELSPKVRLGWTELGFDLLGGGYPHLGIATARGLLPFINEPETDYFLEAIEEKRDELSLQPFDISEELALVFTDISDDRKYREKERKLEKQVSEDLESRNADLAIRERELNQLRKELGKIKQNSDRTEREAAKRIAELESESAQARDAGNVNSEHEAEITELREKMRRLKNEVKRKHEQRNELRRDLRKVRSELGGDKGDKGSEMKPSGETMERAEEKLLSDFDQEGEAAQPLRIPVFPDGFLKKKRDFPGSVISAALQLTGRLASGDSSAFQGVKRLKLRRRILRQKVAGSYRLLFSIEKNELRIVDLINRRDLEKWLSE